MLTQDTTVIPLNGEHSLNLMDNWPCPFILFLMWDAHSWHLVFIQRILTSEPVVYPWLLYLEGASIQAGAWFSIYYWGWNEGCSIDFIINFSHPNSNSHSLPPRSPLIPLSLSLSLCPVSVVWTLASCNSASLLIWSYSFTLPLFSATDVFL